MADIVDSASSEQQVDACPLLGASVTPQAFAKVDSRPLQELLGLTTNPRDLSQNLDGEAGLAVLDTRGFHSMLSADLISTYNFTSGSSDYQGRTRKKSLFGDSVTITQNNMLKSIEFLVPPDRQVVFVGHDIRHDLRGLNLLNFDFTNFNITTLDTQSISQESTTLRCLLLTPGCPFTKLHCGRNDPNFTLKTLLLLVVRDCVIQSRIEERLVIMKEVALSPLPHYIQSQTEITEVTIFSSYRSSDQGIREEGQKITTEPKATVKDLGLRNAREILCRAGC